MEKHREGRNLLPRTRLRTDRRHIISRLLKSVTTISVSCSTLYTYVHKKGCVGGVVDTWHVYVKTSTTGYTRGGWTRSRAHKKWACYPIYNTVQNVSHDLKP